MRIYELNYPGTWLNYPDGKTNMDILCLLSLVEKELSQAVMALQFYVADYRRWNEELQRNERQDRDSMLDADARIAKWSKEMEERRELVDKYTRELGNGAPFSHLSWEQLQEIMLRVEAELNQEKIEAELNQEKSESAAIPREYKSALSLLYSKSFITSLDTIGRLIDSLCNLVNDFQPEQHAFDVKKEFADFFGNFRDVRNSIQHSEQRILGLTHRTPIVLKPIDVPGLYAPNGAVALNGLGSETYGTLVADGHYAIVELNTKSLETVQDCIQKVINTLKWKGHPRQYPD